MDISTISQLVGTVGFPIAVTAYLLWDAHQSRQEHAEEMDKVTTALNNNTEAIVKLSDRIAYLENVPRAIGQNPVKKVTETKQDPSPSE